MPPVSRNCVHRVPGPDPVFTERTVVRLRPDQVRQLDRVAKAFRLTRSDVMRLAVDMFGRAIEEGPWLARLEEVEVEP